MSLVRRLALALVFCTAAASVAQDPPRAEPRRVEKSLFGRTLYDDYGWLRDRENPEVIRYLESENAYAEQMLAHTRAFQEQLFQEIKSRTQETDLEVPERKGDYLYYSRTEAGKQYRIHCRKRDAADAAEEILLDENQLAAGRPYFALGGFAVSPSHALLAYAVDFEGSEIFEVRVKDLSRGSLLEDAIPGAYYGIVWANDNETLFYTRPDAAHRPHQLWRHALGAPASEDVLVHEELDDRFYVDVSRTHSDEYILLQLGSQITSEVRYLDADTPWEKFQAISPREQGVEYDVEHHGERFLVTTNDDAMNFRLLSVPVGQNLSSATELISHRRDVLLEGVLAFRDYVVVQERAAGLPTLRVRDLNHGEEHSIEFPEPAYSVFVSDNPEFDSATLRYVYSSMVTPRSIYDYDMKSRERKLLKRQPVLGGFDPEHYVSERLTATALDGEQVPISLMYRRGLRRDGGNPLLLEGYGAYGYSNDPAFSAHELSLVDRGVIVATAHVRGGSEMGRAWYDSGKLLKKRNTFTDFIACAERLIAEGYTTADRLAASGGSAGGLLIGAVANMRPDLFEVMIAKVPFVDVMNTMLDASIPLTVIEYEEWGNPNEAGFFEYMLGYSPYDNVTAQNYPHMLITAGLNDPRVGYWEPAKWTARLRAARTGDSWLLLRTNMGAGHGGPSGRYDAWRERAFEYAFLLDRLGVRP